MTKDERQQSYQFSASHVPGQVLTARDGVFRLSRCETVSLVECLLLQNQKGSPYPTSLYLKPADRVVLLTFASVSLSVAAAGKES
jgi:hypothetical protein